MPTSLTGVVLFVAMLGPGLLFALRRERTAYARPASALRETLTVVAVSIAALIAAGILLAAARAAAPGWTVDVGALLRDPAEYAVAHHVRLAWWSLAGFLLACGLAVAGADPRLARALGRASARAPARALLGTSDTDIRAQSAWTKAFTMYDDDPAGPGEVIVGAQLEDGTYVRGTLCSHSPDVVDSADRELVLQAPIGLRTTDGAWTDLGVSYAVVSARRAVRLDVTHLAPS